MTNAPIAEALRDLEAAKARVERDATAAANRMKKALVEDLLPVMDNLDRTVAMATGAGESPALVEGTRMVRAQLAGVLRGYGVEQIDASGAAFDPAVHDAISTASVTTPEADGTVIEQIAPGYTFGGALLRPAQVVVGKVPAELRPVEAAPAVVDADDAEAEVAPIEVAPAIAAQPIVEQPPLVAPPRAVEQPRPTNHVRMVPDEHDELRAYQQRVLDARRLAAREAEARALREEQTREEHAARAQHAREVHAAREREALEYQAARERAYREQQLRAHQARELEAARLREQQRRAGYFDPWGRRRGW